MARRPTRSDLKPTQIIQAKPTSFMGVQFRSRLEARWSFFLQENQLVESWKYEPTTVRLLNGWEYTPDFLIKVRKPIMAFGAIPHTPLEKTQDFYLEVKPNVPSTAYENTILSFGIILARPLFIVYGNWYDIPFHVGLVSDRAGSKGVSAAFDQMLFTDRVALESARNHRFDLRS